MFVRPAPGRRVRLPDGRLVPDSGLELPAATPHAVVRFVYRALAEGDLTVEPLAAPEPDPTAPPAPDPTAPAAPEPTAPAAPEPTAPAAPEPEEAV